MDWLFGWYPVITDAATQAVILVSGAVIGAVLAPELMGIATWF